MKLGSFSLQNSSWFFKNWKKDPTVQAMLNMLDAIHLKMKNEDLEVFWQHLKSELNIISFKFLNLEEFELVDELYGDDCKGVGYSFQKWVRN